MIFFSLQSSADDLKDNLPVSVNAAVDKTTLFIGDRLKYTIEVKTKDEIEVRLPEFGDNLAGFTIKDFGSSKGGFWGSRTLTQWYLIDIYETGEFTIPGAVIRYRSEGSEKWKELLTDEIRVEVLSVLDRDAEKAEIRDIKGPVRFRTWTYLYITLAVLALAAAIIFLLWFISKKIKTKEESLPPEPAHEIALRALKELLDKAYLKKGEVQQHYYELSDIIRHYMENRFEMKAPEMTTEEFLAALKSSSILDDDQKSILRDFLSHCDMVKFAKYIPGEAETGSSYDSAKELIERTKEVTLEGTV